MIRCTALQMWMEGIGQGQAVLQAVLPTEPSSLLIFSSLTVIKSSLKNGPYTDPLDKPSDKRGAVGGSTRSKFLCSLNCEFPFHSGVSLSDFILCVYKSEQE